MLKRLRTALRHPVSKNVMGLYSIQIAQFIVPIVTLPYVARVLEPSAFGIVVFSQGFAFVLVVFIDWGFSFTGIRSTAEKQSSPEELSVIVQRVRGAQLLLSLGSVVVALGALILIPKMHHHPEYLALAWVAAAATGLSPSWFFLGTENMRTMALIQVAFRALGAALTFVFVRGPGDAWVVMALFAGGAIGSLAAADLMMYRGGVTFRRPQLRASAKEIRGATMIFVSTIAVTLYTSFNVVLLGLFQPSSAVAHFGAAERIVRVAMTVLGPIGAAIIPRLTALQAAGNHARARRLLTLAVAAGAIPALLITGVLIAGAPEIVRVIYGSRFEHASAPILRVLSLIIPVDVIGVVFGMWLMTLHRDKLVASIVVCAGVGNIVIGSILTPLMGPIGMAWSVLAAEVIAALGGILTVRLGARRAARAAAVPPTLVTTGDAEAADLEGGPPEVQVRSS